MKQVEVMRTVINFDNARDIVYEAKRPWDIIKETALADSTQTRDYMLEHARGMVDVDESDIVLPDGHDLFLIECESEFPWSQYAHKMILTERCVPDDHIMLAAHTWFNCCVVQPECKEKNWRCWLSALSMCRYILHMYGYSNTHPANLAQIRETISKLSDRLKMLGLRCNVLADGLSIDILKDNVPCMRLARFGARLRCNMKSGSLVETYILDAHESLITPFLTLFT
jgi:hypothetical protein